MLRSGGRSSRALALNATAILCAGFALISGNASAGPGLTVDPFAATALQGNVERNGHSDSPLGRDLSEVWDVTVPGDETSSPVIVDGRVFVTYRAAGQSLPSLEAISVSDGSVVWGPEPLATASWSHPSEVVYDAGLLFTAVDNGTVQAWDPATGEMLWTRAVAVTQLDTHIVAGDGIMAVAGAGSGGTLSAFSEAGRLTCLVEAHRAAGRERRNGHLQRSSCVSRRVLRPRAQRGQRARLFGRLTGLCRIRDSATRRTLAGHPSTAIWFMSRDTDPVLSSTSRAAWPVGQDPARGVPSFDGSDEFWISDHVVHAASMTTNVEKWTSSATDYASPMITVGGMVIAEAPTGRIDALDEGTGEVVWTTSGLPPSGNAASYAMLVVGMAAGDGILVVPAGSRLRAFASATSGLPSAPSRPSVPAPTLPDLPLVPPALGTSWLGFGGKRTMTATTLMRPRTARIRLTGPLTSARRPPIR